MVGELNFRVTKGLGKVLMVNFTVSVSSSTTIPDVRSNALPFPRPVASTFLADPVPSDCASSFDPAAHLAPAGRADQSSGPAGGDLAGGVPAALEEDPHCGQY
eukprot:1180583-Prorocentrum_minimum.AAC.1